MGLQASFRAVRRLCRPADVTAGLADRSSDTSDGQTGRHLNRAAYQKGKMTNLSPIIDYTSTPRSPNNNSNPEQTSSSHHILTMQALADHSCMTGSR